MAQEKDFEALYLQSQKLIELLTKQVDTLNNTIKLLQNENKQLKESVDYLTRKIYGPKSEKASSLHFEQIPLFNEAEEEADPSIREYQVEEEVSFKKTRRPGRLLKDKFANVPHRKVLIQMPEELKHCPVCGSRMYPVGEEFVRYEIEFIPARLCIKDVYRETYECRKCRRGQGSSHMYNSPVPDAVIPHSYASPATIAYIMTQKFVSGIPLYRQENEWKNLGIGLSRQTMSNWILKADELYLSILVRRMQEYLVGQKYVHADETRVQVLNEPGRKNTSQSYMWVYSTIKESAYPIRLFDYRPTRSGNCAAEYLKGFKGYLISDAYQGYNAVPDVTRCYCWAHARRYFVDALPKNISSEEAVIPSEAIQRIGKLFSIEKKLTGKPKETIKKTRQEKEKPLLDEFFLWLENQQDGLLPSSKLYKAVNYVLNQKEGLSQYIQDPNIPMTNSLDERTIRPFAIGRKNWLFSGSPKGAEASASCYSLIETAKANGLEPFKYLNYIFQYMPGSRIEEKEILDSFLPWNKDIQNNCK